MRQTTQNKLENLVPWHQNNNLTLIGSRKKEMVINLKEWRWGWGEHNNCPQQRSCCRDGQKFPSIHITTKLARSLNTMCWSRNCIRVFTFLDVWEDLACPRRFSQTFYRYAVKSILTGCTATALLLTAWTCREQWTQLNPPEVCSFLHPIHLRCIASGRLEVSWKMPATWPFSFLRADIGAWKPECPDLH